jgi:hypothetical protein
MPTPADLSLAVGDGARRMTYAELAQARQISLASARRLARRHHWPRQVGNDGIVRVIVPLGHLQTGPGPAPPATLETLVFDYSGPAQAMSDGTKPPPESDIPGTRPMLASATAHGTGPGTEALSRAVDSLRELLVIANSRADRAEQRADTERARGDQLQTELSQAQRELIEERRWVIEILTGDRRPWWRRWFR